MFDQSLEASRKEGIAAQITGGILDYYLIPFALMLGADTRQIGLLIAIPSLLAAVCQFFVVDVLKFFGNRRRLLIIGALMQGLILFPIPFFAYLDFPPKLYLLAAFISAFKIIGGIMGPAWGSLMSDYLPPHRRGDYFGRRSQLIGIIGMLCTALCGFFLYFIRPISAGLAFLGIFMVASFSRIYSCKYMALMDNLPEHHHPDEEFSLGTFARRLKESNFARFLIYVLGITFAVQLSSAYFSVHLLRDLKYDYLTYMAVMLAATISGFASYPLWGKHADMVGNAHVMRLNSFLIPVMPFLWIFSESPLYLLCVELLGGFVWAGFNLCTTNFIYEAVEPAKRVRALGYFNLITGMAVFAGAYLGGYLADKLPPLLGHSLHTLFLISAVCRLCADLALSKRFKEVRAGGPAVSSARLFFSVVGMRPLL